MTILGLVTARAGSKRLPGKNLAQIHGEPLTWWAWKNLNIAAKLLEADGHETRLRLSTDSIEIGPSWPLDHAPMRNGNWDLRPDWLCGDDAKSADVCVYEILRHKTIYGKEPDAVILLQPTSPCVLPQDIVAVFNGFKEQAIKGPREAFARGIDDRPRMGEPFGI